MLYDCIFTDWTFSNIKSLDIMSIFTGIFCRSMPKLFVRKNCSEVFRPWKINYMGKGTRETA